VKPYRIERNGRKYWAQEIPAHFLPPGSRRKIVMASSKEELEKRWNNRVNECRRGLDSKGGKMLLADFLEKEFLPQCAGGGGIESTTVADYRYHVDFNILPFLGQMPLNRIGPREIDGFVQALRQKVSERTKRRLAPKTVRYAHGVLRSALQLAVDYGYIAVNPASAQSRRSRIRLPKGAIPVRFFSLEASQKFLKAVQGDRHEALYTVALTTGLRKGELLGLAWSDIDLAAARLTVNHSLQFTRRRKGDKEPRWVLKGPKTALSRRTIEIPAVAVAALQRHRDGQLEDQELAGDEWQEMGLVFTSGRGTPLDTANALHRFHEICREAGLPEIRFYDLRHTHASLLIHEGVHAKKIAERLGHSSIKLTMDTYGHLFEGSDRESAERMDQLFGGQKENPEEAPKKKPAKGKVVEMPRRRVG
jgi:integrase